MNNSSKELKKNVTNERENWTVITEESDSYPESRVAVYAEDDCGETYVAACAPDFQWYVTIGEQTHYIPDCVKIVRWCPLECVKPRNLSWPIDLAETLAEELEYVVDTMNDASSYESAEEMAEALIETVKMVGKSLLELGALLRSASKGTKYSAEDTPAVNWYTEDKTTDKVHNEAATIAKIRLTGSGEGELDTSKRILDFLLDVKEHKLDDTIAELGINVLTPKGYASSVFLSIRDGELESSILTERGFIRLPFEFPYPGRDLGNIVHERWDIIEERIYKAKEEQEKAWEKIVPGSTIYQRRPFSVEKIIPLHVREKNDILIRAEDELGSKYEFLKISANVMYYADKDKAEAYLKATPVKKK